MSEFNDRPLMVGSITGTRAFKVDALGRLTGVTYPEVWKPGVNTATCKAASSPFYSASIAYVTAYYNGMATGGPITSKPEPNAPPDHQPGTKGCGCGYWAYFDGSNGFHDDSRVAAVVEGTGTVTVGTKGFRAEKAKIVALVDPTMKSELEPEPEPAEPRWDRFARWTYRNQWATYVGIYATTALIVGTVAAFTAADAPAWIGPLLSTLTVLAGVFVGTSMKGFTRGLDLKYSATVRATHLHFQDEDPELDTQRWERVRRNYPDVPVYPTLAAALADHPLSEPPEPEPITPENTPDFWTRKATP